MLCPETLKDSELNVIKPQNILDFAGLTIKIKDCENKQLENNKTECLGSFARMKNSMDLYIVHQKINWKSTQNVPIKVVDQHIGTI